MNSISHYFSFYLPYPAFFASVDKTKNTHISTKNNCVIIAATPIINPTPSSDETPPKTICAPWIVNNIHKNMDQIAANVALG